MRISRSFACWCLLICLISSRVGADQKIVTKYVSEQSETVTTEYTKGARRRTEVWTSNGKAQHQWTVLNAEKKRTYYVDADARQYVESPLLHTVDPLLQLAFWLHRSAPVHNSGKTVNIYFETVDTGERQTLFGKTAFHLIRKHRTAIEPGACETESEEITNGWYFPPVKSGRDSVRDASAGYRIIDMFPGGGECKDNVIQHGHRDNPGFAMQETRKSVLTFGQNKIQRTDTSTVLDYSEAVLDSALFEPPGNFSKVDALPGESVPLWSDQLKNDWRLLEAAVDTWF